MFQGGVTELIWHFAGYIHFTDEIARARVHYEDLAAQRSEAELAFDEPADEPVRNDLDELGSGRTDVFWPEPVQSVQPMTDIGTRLLSVDPPEIDFRQIADQGFVQSYLISKIIYTFTGFERGPDVTRQEGGDETSVDLDQYNLLNDSDLFGVRIGLTTEEVSGVDVRHEIGNMRAMAESAVPDNLFPAGGGNIAVVGPNLADILHDKAQMEETPSNVEMGLHVNGVLQSDAPDAEQTIEETVGTGEGERRDGAPPPLADQPDNWKPGDPGLVAAELGSNTSYNGAIIVDADEASGTFVVLGDYYKTNVIAQVNVYSDSDHVTIGGGAAAEASVHFNQNETINSAELISESLIDGMIDYRGYTGYSWDIDISYGDYYDVKSLYQENVLYSNDITYQVSENTHQRLMVDENGQWNSAFVEDYGNNYDLIVVLGNYYSGNFIHQTNLLLDNDWVVMSAGEEGGSQTVHGGQNALSNEASITSYSVSGFGEVSAGFESFLRGLETRDDIAPEEWWSFSGSGSTDMRVLFTTGDYYDINYIEQLNLIADADSAIQISGNDADQFVSTGGNTATNFAAIVDVGAYGDQYVGGEVYEDWTLIQTNMVASEEDTVVYGDSDQMASEVVAFAFTDEDEVDLIEPGAMPISMGGDELGHIMC